MLRNTQPGARIVITIGRKGQKPDEYPARLAEAPHFETVNGQPVRMATVLAQFKTLAGETYIKERLHNLRFSFDRAELVEMLDGTAENPKSIGELISEAQESVRAYWDSLPSADVITLTEDEA